LVNRLKARLPLKKKGALKGTFCRPQPRLAYRYQSMRSDINVSHLASNTRFENKSGLPGAAFSRMEPTYRLNAICPYYTMFPLEFPWGVLRDAKANDWVLDPFCGRGTSLYAARLRGLGAVGLDLNPVAVTLAATKLKSTSHQAVTSLCAKLLSEAGQPVERPSDEFWNLAFHLSTLKQICLLRERLANAGADATTTVLRALLLGVLHGPILKGPPSFLSNQMPRTYSSKPGSAVRYWKKHDLLPPKVDVLDVVRRRAIHTLSAVPPTTPGYVRQGDAVTDICKIDRQFKWVITSPPYYGMRTYAPDQWLRNWFLGGPPVVTYEVPGDLQHTGEDVFIGSLAKVWRAAATKCENGAQLVIRFGSIPSLKKDPHELIQRSLNESDSGWKLNSVVPAGFPSSSSRQASQFSLPGNYIEEMDFYATLEH